MASDELLTAGQQAEIERWFVRRGVPQLVEGYTTEQRMDARAAPLIIAWVVLATILWWGVRDGWPPLLNVASAVGTIAFIGLAWQGQHVLRRRRGWGGPSRIDMLDVAAFGVLIGIAAGLVEWSVREAYIAGLNGLAGIGVAYIVIGFGLLEIGRWGLNRLATEAARIAGLVARTLPILLILVLFLLFASEIWQAAHELNIAELVAVLALMVGIAVLLIVTALRSEMRGFKTDSWEAIWIDARPTPAGILADAMSSPSAEIPPLTWIQRLNVTLLVVLGQLIQSIFVALVVTGFLVVLGLLALPASLQELWVGDELSVATEFSLLGEIRTLSAELVTVCALLGGVVGLYFTGLAVTDAAYRTEHFSRVVDEVRQILAARSVYVAALRRREAG